MSVTIRAKLPKDLQNAGQRSINVRQVLVELPTDQCVEWPGMRTKDYGYGVIASHITHLAHRYVWMVVHGRTPDLPELDHLCRNPPCCNPAHLEPVTGAENRRRRDAARTHCPNGHAYTAENVYEYRGSRMCRTCRRQADRQRPSGGARRRQRGTLQCQ